jgi:hypothetical protein
VQVKVTQEGDGTTCDWKAAADVFYGMIDFKKDLYDLKIAIRTTELRSRQLP